MGNQPDGFSYNVAANLLRLRLSRGWSMDHVAAQAGISLVLVEQAERGGLALQRDVLNALADAFDVSLDELGTAPSELAQGCTDILDRDP
ncbi:MAG: helix-turn-helix domain-containing protein, partial [Clostridia bacterium]